MKSREEEVAVLEAQIEVLRNELMPLTERTLRQGTDQELDKGQASFVLAARMHRRYNTTGIYTPLGLREPILDLYYKTAGRKFAAAHGVAVPQILGSWSDPDAVDWENLPDRFVLKADHGGGGMNVFPLERSGTEFIDHLTKEPTSRETVTASLWKKHRRDAVYFAEEFLVGVGGTDTVPNDVKVFCFYGDAAYIEVRAEDTSRAKNAVQRLRTFLPDGTELAKIRPLIEQDPNLDPPNDIQGIVEAAQRLSAAIRRPIARIDFYETDRGLVFGEITQNPGRPPALVTEWDRRFGISYEEAYARLIVDLTLEGALQLEFGAQSA